MLNFSDVLQRGVKNWKDVGRDVEADEGDCFRGSNTPYIYKGEFVTDSNNHCPRQAMMRRAKMPTGFEKSFKDYASHMYGRGMEEYVKKLIVDASVEGLVTAEEEQFAAKLSVNGQVIYSARPDLVLFMNGVPQYVCEFKSVQSNSTAEAVFLNKMPKLGAGIQCVAQMHIHDIPNGLIAYILGHWVQGYSYATKKQIKYEPGFCTFPVTFAENGDVLVDNKPTILNRFALEQSISMLNDMWETGKMPALRPLSLKLDGTKMPYDCCEYCAYGPRQSGVCDRAEGYNDGCNIENFKDFVREAFIL